MRGPGLAGESGPGDVSTAAALPVGDAGGDGSSVTVTETAGAASGAAAEASVLVVLSCCGPAWDSASRRQWANCEGMVAAFWSDAVFTFPASSVGGLDGEMTAGPE